MKKEPKRFDLNKEPKKCPTILGFLKGIYANAPFKKHQVKLTKIGMEGIKPPYFLLCNHNAIFDTHVAIKALGKAHANFVVAIDGYIGREGFMRTIGCICKRKFTSDPKLLFQLKHAVNMGCVPAMYPEARYSLCGTTAVLPKSLGVVCKFLKVPIVTLICHGHHINHPFWNTSHDRGVKPTEATMKLLLTADEVSKISADEINEALVKEFQYDDFAWQKERGIKVNDPNRAQYLDKILYQCPHCGTEFEMESEGTHLHCKHCNKTWEMTELGEMKALEGKTEFSHIPDWYEWERANVRKEVEAGKYSSGKLPVTVESLPNAKKFIKLGKGTIVHDMNGFHVEGIDFDGDKFEMIKDVPSLYSVHVEYNYLFTHGDCVDLNTLEDTWYCYPEGKFAVTKMALATEELYFNYMEKIGKKLPKGMA